MTRFKEADTPAYPAYIARCEHGPVTREWLQRDLAALGLRPGMLLMLHCSLSALGYVPGEEAAVIAAVRGCLGDSGTLLMPSFSSGNTDPANWCNPPVPEEWWETVRAELAPFDPLTSRTRQMGRVAEYFRSLPGIVRSGHPCSSWAALGPLAAEVTANHELDMTMGEGSPLARCYERDAWVLSLGTQRTTILHLAEYRADWPGKLVVRTQSAMFRDGERVLVGYDDLDSFDEDFETIRQEFMAAFPGHSDGTSMGEGDAWASGPAGYGEARLFRVRPLVDFAAKWIGANRDWSDNG
ncbi:AAC(3) family N-acetyltransferase [bacterium]|nr:AAC(3) family N-acetyltransferase [bacterium]